MVSSWARQPPRGPAPPFGVVDPRIVDVRRLSCATGEGVDVEVQALAINLKKLAAEVIELMPELPAAATELIESITDPGHLADLIAAHPIHHWVEGLAKVNVPCGPINTVDQVFAEPQVQAREMVLGMSHPLAHPDPVRLIASPIRMSGTPVSYRNPPPLLGQHTDEVLGDLLGLGEDELAGLRRRQHHPYR